ncbi:MAG: glycerophosphodiester phosphodiesterase family protein [Sphingomonadaceae bacterium]
MRSSLFAPLEQLIAPAPPPARVAFLKSQPFAHRGLHGRGVIENSRAAFRAAVAIGHGIELDVQGARDGEAVVFHDATLERLTGATGRVAALPVGDLERIALAGVEETLVQLPVVLGEIGGRVPVLIEIKGSGEHVAPLCLSVRRALEGYRGPAAVMAFNPHVPAWFKTHAPRIVRGLVVSEEGRRGLRGDVVRWLAMRRAGPDFLAYDVRDLPSRFAAAARGRGIPVLTWTVRDAAAERTASVCADEAIYERAR